MPGYLSRMFDGADQGDEGEGQRQLSAEGALDVEQDVGVQNDIAFSF